MSDNQSDAHPLTGMAILEFNERGVCRQGTILGAFEGRAVVQLYSWIMGEPSNVALIPIAMIGDFDWRKGEVGWLLFTNDEARNDFYDSRVTPWQNLRDKAEDQ